MFYGYNKDSIYITNSKMKFRNKKDIKVSTKEFGKVFETDSKPTYFDA